MAIGGIQGAQQALALSGVRGANARTEALGEAVSQTLQAAEQRAQPGGQAGGLQTPADSSRVQPGASADGSRGTRLDVLA